MNVDDLKDLRPKEALIVIKSLGLRQKYEKRLIQRYVEELSCTDIADLENKEVQTIRNEVSKARKIFNKFMEG